MQPFATLPSLIITKKQNTKLFDSFPKRKIPAIKCGDFCFRVLLTLILVTNYSQMQFNTNLPAGRQGTRRKGLCKGHKDLYSGVLCISLCGLCVKLH
jgi:hypothetical protein